MRKYMVFKILVLVNFLLLTGFQVDAHAGSDSDRVKENIRTLQNSKACPGCDLSGAELNRMDLSGADLQGADLTEAKLYLVNFSGANLQNAHLQRASLGGADLGGADLRGADLQGAELNGAYLEGAKFDGEFVKAKPYEEEGLPETEKKSSDAAVKPIESERKSEDKADHKTVNVQKVTHDQKPDQSVVPPVKVDEPIKKILVSGNLEPSTDVPGQPDMAKKEDISQTQEKKLQETAVNMKERAQNNGAAKDGNQELTEHGIATSAITSSDTKSLPTAVEVEDQKSASLPVENGNTQNVTGGKTSVGEPSSIKKSEKNQTLVEKDLLTEKQADKEKSTREASVQSEEISNDKANTIKSLLKTKKCYQCDLAGVDLSDKNLDGADLEGSNLAGSNLEKTDLSKAVLKGASFVGANLKKANLKGADLYRANLSGANLTDANMENAKVDGALFVGAIGR